MCGVVEPGDPPARPVPTLIRADNIRPTSSAAGRAALGALAEHIPGAQVSSRDLQPLIQGENTGPVPPFPYFFSLQNGIVYSPRPRAGGRADITGQGTARCLSSERPGTHPFCSRAKWTRAFPPRSPQGPGNRRAGRAHGGAMSCAGATALGTQQTAGKRETKGTSCCTERGQTEPRGASGALLRVPPGRAPMLVLLWGGLWGCGRFQMCCL